MAATDARVDAPSTSTGWWRDAVGYQVYLRSFRDGDGDGVGDLHGLHDRLPYLAELGIDIVWVTPCYPSPGADHGYDVSDYLDVDEQFGGRGIGTALVRGAVEATREEGITIVPVCSMVEGFLGKNADEFAGAYREATDADRARFGGEG